MDDIESLRTFLELDIGIKRKSYDCSRVYCFLGGGCYACTCTEENCTL